MQSQEGSKLGRNISIFAAVFIITVAVVLSIASSWNDSLIVDEVPHIGAGYSYLAKQDMRLNPEHPPLAKDLAAIPLLFLNLNQSAFQSKFWQTDVNGQWEFGRLLIFNSGNNADLIRHLARLPILLFFVLSAVLIFKWARRLYGNIGAITALILFSFSSTVIAHSRFVTTDMAALFGVLLATYFFINYLRNQTAKNLIIAGLTFGIALLCKFCTALLVPFFVILALFYRPPGAMKKYPVLRQLLFTLLIFIIGVIVVLWPIYYLHTYNYPPERQQADTEHILTAVYRQIDTPLSWVIQASSQPLLRPLAHYSLGFLRVAHQNAEPHDVFFLGDVLFYGSRFYFPTVYFLKEPLAWWGLAAISLLYIAWQFRKPETGRGRGAQDFIRNHFEEFAMILWLMIYLGMSIRSTLNIGVRHLLPIFPFAILLVGGQLTRLGQKLKEKGEKWFLTSIFLLSTLLIWYVVENIKTFPLYLTYFNQVAGGPSGGYRYVTDSNLDWGQDLIRFRDWVKKNNIPKIELDYFGWADQSYYLGPHFEWLWREKYLGADDFKARNKSDGWLAISITYLQETQGPVEHPKYPNYLWLKSYQPVAVIGNSIWVYRIK
jgi:dolichyl-phosphate-mannose--protein O-mannosyl transferase